ncbi:MAG: hypothetical protein A3B31_03745 [Candidatus Komeilibacteria bacterium RIFCSPLOWO2_01_FULL_53_11]|uniref:Uncharacterized protein n=1 Tax=Candidatus Komeilibacteria bacterium RIFCSPLOWO2_01_FULL_53_11 TaxID=1798552 RepID=A0A1G2BNP4_9BACT|nr:MAG: hypothetical protein A3B31_03745 [Candidatus Komeilibacteria bacterium RIFCSPLOWO2_01_FULL_53_11]
MKSNKSFEQFEQPAQDDEQETRPNESTEKLRERLSQLVPAFLEIRQKMGFDDRIGFGFLEEVHSGGISLGSLPTVKKLEGSRRKYSLPGLLGQETYETMTEEDKKNILIMPNPQHQGKIVSVFDPSYDWGDGRKRLINASDDLFIGVIAHELAHDFTFGSQLPKHIVDILIKRLNNEHGITYKSWRGSGNEEEIDIIASLFGYKDQIIEKIDFMIERVQQYGPRFKNKERIIKELECRKQQVLKYCP